MSAFEITKKLTKSILQGSHDFYLVNFANPDMVGHTADIPATVRAVETVDHCVGEVVEAILSKGGSCLVTADHGNAEELRNLQTGELSKDHTTNPVPCIIIRDDLRGLTNPLSQTIGHDLSLLKPAGILSDVTVTALAMMNIEISKKMNGESLL
jgi:2,3-bisphosphoglycerate-independent phosphoglycerate mutase